MTTIDTQPLQDAESAQPPHLNATPSIKKHSDTISVADYFANPSRFNVVLDARTPAEFALDHLPTALNTPVLSDAQRVTVGTLDKQVSSFEAKRVGAGMVSSNIGELLKTPLFEQPRDWSPLVYCWRGGNRSGSLAHVLRKIGWRSVQLEGGYKAFRNHVIASLETLPTQFEYRVIAGRTGAGKTRLLQALAAQGAQVLDLEAIALHRGSVLGNYMHAAMIVPQPSQKAFETQVWRALSGFDASRPVFVESESAKVGNVRVPEALIAAMRASPCITLEATIAQRVALLCEEYAHFTAVHLSVSGENVQNNATELNTQLQRLTAHYGTAQIELWQAQGNAAQWHDLVETLLVKHYDPAYDKSLGRNYVQIDVAQHHVLRGITENDFAALAKQLRVGVK
jgi:tRNA 2-selenouridine synthase